MRLLPTSWPMQSEPAMQLSALKHQQVARPFYAEAGMLHAVVACLLAYAVVVF